MSKRKPKKFAVYIDKRVQAALAVNDPWPVICPACEGKGKKVIKGHVIQECGSEKALRAAVGFDWQRHNWNGQYGRSFEYTFFCARCDGRGTIVA